MSTSPKSFPRPDRLSVGVAATLACVYEATAEKPGNVHPRASFDDDTNYVQFVTSAVIICPILERAAKRSVGQTVLDAVRATQRVVGTNTNLGTLLLVAPLAAVPAEQMLEVGVRNVLKQLTTEDTRLVYEAIRTSDAGALGQTPEANVFDPAPPNLALVDAMQLAAERDLVARQYVTGFADVFHGTARGISEGLARGWPLGAAIVRAHVQQMAAQPDSLIERKCGVEVAGEAQDRARQTLAVGEPGDPPYQQALVDLDHWLRADGHRRNPGTTADLIAAGLFVLLREGRLDWKVW